MTARVRCVCIAMVVSCLGIVVPASSLGTAGGGNRLSTSGARPLLREFGDSIAVRVRDSKLGRNRFGLEKHFSSGACDKSAE